MAIGGKNDLKYKITVDEKGAVTSIKKFGKEVDSTTKTATKSFKALDLAVKATAVGAIAGAVLKMKSLASEVLTLGDRLGKLHTRLGADVKQLDKLRQVANLSGVSFETLTLSLQRMTRQIGDLSVNGTGPAGDALKQLGINIEKIKNLRSDQQFLIITKALSNVADVGERATLAFKMFGISGVQINQMLPGLKNNLEDVNSNFTNENAASIENFNDKLTQLGEAMLQLAVKFIPVIEGLTRMLELMGGGERAVLERYKMQLEDHKDRLEDINEELKDGKGWLERQTSWQKRQNGLLEERERLLKNIERLNKKIEVSPVNSNKNKSGSLSVKVPPSIEPLKPIGNDILKNAETTEFQEQWKLIKQREEAEIKTQDEIDQIWNEATETYRTELEKRNELNRKSQEDMIKYNLEQRNAELEAEKRAIEEQQQMIEDFSKSVNNSIASNLSDGFTDIITGAKDAKEAFGDMARSMLNDLIRITTQWLIITTLKQFGMTFEKGGVFSGGNVTPFASGGVVTSPTFFPMANGSVGLMGEAGPEAVMPLTRLNNGKLGVEAEGNGGGGDQKNYNISINAVDAKSFAELCKRNPNAIITPFTDQVNKGNQGLRTTLRKGAN